MRRLGLVFSLLIVVGCGDDPTGPKATDVILNFETLTLPQLDSVQLVPSFVDSKGTLITSVPATFTSSDPAIVSVSNIGMIRSLGPAGSATISIRGAGLTKTVPVTVRSVGTKLVVMPNPGVMPQKGTLQLVAQVRDRVDAPIPGASFGYESANPSIITVSPSGLLTSIGPAGTVAITVRSEQFATTIQVAVTQVPTKLVVQAPTPLRLGATRSTKVAVLVLDAVDVPIPGHVVRYTSLHPAIVSVAADGTITSVGPLGTATVHIEAVGTNLTANLQVLVASATSPTGNVVDTVEVGGGYAVALTATKALVVGPFGAAGVSVDLQTRAVSPLSGETGAFAIAVSRDQRHAYLTTDGGALRRIDLAAGTFQDLPLAAQGYGLALSRNGLWAYVGTDSDQLIVVNLTTFAIAERIRGTGGGLHITLDALDQFAYLSFDSPVREVNLSTRIVARTFPVVRGQAHSLSADGRTLYVGTENGAVASVDLAAGATGIFRAMPDCGSWGIAATPDDRFLYLACSGQWRVDVLDIQTRTVVRQYTGIPEPRRVAVSDDGSVVAVAAGLKLLLFR